MSQGVLNMLLGTQQKRCFPAQKCVCERSDDRKEGITCTVTRNSVLVFVKYIDVKGLFSVPCLKQKKPYCSCNLVQVIQDRLSVSALAYS